MKQKHEATVLGEDRVHKRKMFFFVFFVKMQRMAQPSWDSSTQ